MTLYSLGGEAPKTPGEGRYWVAPGAHVMGKVVIGEDVGIWFGAVLRGDNEPIELGDGTNIQEGTVIHTDPGKPVKIGPRDLEGYLGMPLFRGEQVLSGTGIITGLAWTSMGGATLPIEATRIHTLNRGFKLTGQLGEVMKESAEIAYS